MTRIIGLQDIKTAAGRIAGRVRRTPILRGDKLDALWGAEVYFKPENLQITGSFKIRGATNKILSLTEEERAKGIIASSSGNHAQGVAYAAKMLGIKATLVLPENAPKSKIEGTKALGAEVVLHGFDSIQRYKKLYEIKAEKGYTLVHSFNDPELIAGQGTSASRSSKIFPTWTQWWCPSAEADSSPAWPRPSRRPAPQCGWSPLSPPGSSATPRAARPGSPWRFPWGPPLPTAS